jgi:hypothetical protein
MATNSNTVMFLFEPYNVTSTFSQFLFNRNANGVREANAGRWPSG